ncbi:MAG: asparagine synthase-related protein [Christensenellales bacterium]
MKGIRVRIAQSLFEIDEAESLFRRGENEVCLLCGCPKDIDTGRMLSGEDALSLFGRYRETVTEHIAGLYTMVVYISPAMYVFQGEISGMSPVYYFITDGGLTVDTSLKRLVRDIPAPRKLNWRALDPFFKTGLLPDDCTLCEGIRRVPPQKALRYDTQTRAVRLTAPKYSRRKATVPHSFEEYGQRLECAVYAAKEDTPAATALSGGFDSNLILWALRNEPEIACFTIGGKRGKDETKTAEEIAAQYENVRLKKALVDENALAYFPDIVLRLDGIVFESGVFLQYRLAQFLAENGIRACVFGECADENMQATNALPFEKRLPGLPARRKAWLVLTKNALMMSSFGITPKYPYFEESFLQTARAMYRRNGTEKMYHKRAARHFLPESIYQKFASTGGSTHLSALFADDKALDSLIQSALSCDIHDAKRPVRYHNGVKESRIEYALRVLFVHLFRELFLSGAYDEALREGTIEKPLSEFLSGIPLKENQKFGRLKIDFMNSIYRRALKYASKLFCRA